jgi:Protein of unknown function (DUF2818)
MDVTLTSWFLIALALLAANLPFFGERMFGLIAIVPGRKPFEVVLIEFILLYLLLGVAAYFLEARGSDPFRQGWEFYAISACMFIVLAYPGFVFRYLRKKRD